MQLVKVKPKLPRVHVTVADGETRKSQTITIYDTTPEEVIDAVKRAVTKKLPVPRPTSKQ